MSTPIHSAPRNNSTLINGHASNGHLLTLDEVTAVLRMAPERVKWLTAEYANSLSTQAGQFPPHFTHEDLATLITLHRITQQEDSTIDKANEDSFPQVESPLQSGLSPDVAPYARPSASTDQERENGWHPSSAVQQWAEPASGTANHIPPASSTSSPSAEQKPSVVEQPVMNPIEKAESSVLDRPLPHTVDQMLGEMLSTVANSQQSVLNVQDSIREMLGVIAQDNFNLKHENRKLRERMLELERVISEHQRREETRKEMMESRLRAVEGTLSALQQQMAQLVQLQRQRIRKNWFR